VGCRTHSSANKFHILYISCHQKAVESNFDKRDSLKREKAYKGKISLCVLTRFTGRMCNV
jgi:hypothetical protein